MDLVVESGYFVSQDSDSVCDPFLRPTGYPPTPTMIVVKNPFAITKTLSIWDSMISMNCAFSAACLR